MPDIFEKWQPDPRVVTAVRVTVEEVEAIRNWIRSVYQMPVTEEVSYQRGNEIVIDWEIKYNDNLSTLVGDYLVLDGNRKFRVLSEEQFKKEYVQLTSAVSLESEESKCVACGQDVMRFKGVIWHSYTGRLCPAIMRSAPISDIYNPEKEQENG